MLKATMIALATAGVLALAPAAQAAPKAQGMTQELSAATTVVVKKNRRHVVVREYKAPSYYGYYGPVTYERPYARPRPLWFGVGGYW